MHPLRHRRTPKFFPGGRIIFGVLGIELYSMPFMSIYRGAGFRVRVSFLLSVCSCFSFLYCFF